MGLDAKLINTRTKEKLYIDRAYNIDNPILEANNLDIWIKNKGVPVFFLLDAILDMRDMFTGVAGIKEKYLEIEGWLNKQDEYDYIKLVTEHSDEY